MLRSQLIGCGEHLPGDRLEPNARPEQAGRDPLDNAPLPDCVRIETRPVCEPARSLAQVSV